MVSDQAAVEAESEVARFTYAPQGCFESQHALFASTGRVVLGRLEMTSQLVEHEIKASKVRLFVSAQLLIPQCNQRVYS